jgi:hypothetical protein
MEVFTRDLIIPFRKPNFDSPINLKGVFSIECYDKEGNLKWEEVAKNAATDEGLNDVLNAYFHAGSQTSTWYIGLIKTGNTLDAGDTLASHAGWTEAVVTTDYTGNRHEWTEGAASGKSMTNGATVDFAMLTSITVTGAFLASVATGTAGVLFCTALFTGGSQAVSIGDTLKLTYTVSAAAA